MNKKITLPFLLCLSIFLTGCASIMNHSNNNTANSHGHYEAVGIASWYGRHFNHKRTSSGERYNMYRFTAAHKTLPLNSKAEVTNLLNGKKIIVRINDRGPFTTHRLIDLSYAAAKKLGMLAHGTTPVKVKSLTSV